MTVAEAETVVLSFVPGRTLSERDCEALRLYVVHRDSLKEIVLELTRPAPSHRGKAGRATTGSGA
jgi:hypothetical protein